jgi:5'-nucleotidase
MAEAVTIVHFNDVYEISESASEPVGGAARFQGFMKQVRATSDPLVIFSGDAFSPSVTSSITGGTHIPPVLNLIGVHTATLGNHEFDFGISDLEKLLAACDSAPWMMANLKDGNGNYLVGGKKTLSKFLSRSQTKIQTLDPKLSLIKWPIGMD